MRLHHLLDNPKLYLVTKKGERKELELYGKEHSHHITSRIYLKIKEE